MKKICVLVVEDDPVTADDICACLENAGYEVAGPAYDAAEARSHFAEACFDLALLDIHLDTRAEGIALAAELRALRPVPVIFLTASADDATLTKAGEIRPEHYLLKPFNAAQLKAALSIVLFKHRSPDPSYELRKQTEKLNRTLPEALSGREAELVYLIAEGLSNAEIAERLHISLHTVKTHVKHIFHKTGAESRTQLIRIIHGA